MTLRRARGKAENNNKTDGGGAANRASIAAT